MKLASFLVLLTGLIFAGCQKEEPSASKPTNTSSSGNPLTAPVDYLGAAAKAKQSAVKTLDTAGLNQTVQLFFAQEGRYPKSLNELVRPNYLSKLPEPPFGTKFDYDPASGEVKVVPK